MKLFFTLCLCLAFCLSIMAEDNGKAIEEMILANADKDIEKYRKSDVVIEVVDKKGRPIKNAEISLNQTSSDFLFAANVTLITGDLGGKIPIEHYQYQPRFTTKEQEDEFKRKFADLFNCATLPLYWNSVEPDAGKPDYAAVDRVLEWCKSQNIIVKGHTLVWTHPDNIPQWFRNLPVDEQRKALEKHVRDTVSRYKRRPALGEPAPRPRSSFHLGPRARAARPLRSGGEVVLEQTCSSHPTPAQKPVVSRDSMTCGGTPLPQQGRVMNTHGDFPPQRGRQSAGVPCPISCLPNGYPQPLMGRGRPRGSCDRSGCGAHPSALRRAGGGGGAAAPAAASSSGVHIWLAWEYSSRYSSAARAYACRAVVRVVPAASRRR